MHTQKVLKKKKIRDFQLEFSAIINQKNSKLKILKKKKKLQ